MSDGLRDAFHAAVFSGMSADECRWERENAIVDAVLAMAEMQAIREALDGLADELAHERGSGRTAESMLRGFSLPEHVIAWVVGHE